MGEEEETASKWKAFYMQTRILGPIFISSPILISAPANLLALYYGLIQLNSRVTATRSNSMVTTTNSVVLCRLQVHS